MNVSAIIVTRGNVDLSEILASLPVEWERVVWDNTGTCEVYDGPNRMVSRVALDVPDLAVFGRYAAIEHSSGDLIYVQDDDCVVEDPQAIVEWWQRASVATMGAFVQDDRDFLVANMPPQFRHDFYADHSLVGFGACFHRDLPGRAFTRFALSSHANGALAWGTDGLTTDLFDRTCDVVFTALTPRVLVDVPYRDLPWASDPDRMWKQPEHVGERARMLELALRVREAPGPHGEKPLAPPRNPSNLSP